MRTHWAWYPLLFLVAAVACAAPSTNSFQAKRYDWPQWQGPDRTALSQETGLLQSWPAEGPPLVWKATGLGGGYSTPSVAAGRIFGMGFRGEEEVVWALNETNGKTLWRSKTGPANRKIGYAEGPRSTPTVDGDLLYALGVRGDLVCLETATGKERWRKNLTQDFGGHMMSGWGYSESPLVDGDKVVATPGGATATLVALDKQSGATLWQAQVPDGDGAGYASAIAASVAGQRQYVQFLGRGVVGVAADDGKFLWRYNRPANGTANCSTPVFADESVFAASGYGTGGGLIKLSRHAEATKADEVYFTRNMRNHHGGMVLVEGYLYGADEGLLTCLEFATGKLMWEERRPGKGSIAFADGRLSYRNEGGRMFLIEATPTKYVEHGRFEQPNRSDKSAWPHPVIANGKLYLRDQDLLLCYDVKQP